MRISVIVANYNYARYIGATIHSLINQTIPKNQYEIIVVDDGSTDKSLAALERYRDSIRLISLPHRGQCAACNEGFIHSQGQYIVRVDSDDYVTARFLDLQVLYLEDNKSLDAVSCDYYKVDDKGNWLTRVDATKEPIACGVMFRQDRLFEDGLYTENINVWEDTQFVDRFMKNHTVYNIPLPLYRYRQHADSLTHK